VREHGEAEAVKLLDESLEKLDLVPGQLKGVSPWMKRVSPWIVD
jgi:hypothetical protein